MFTANQIKNTFLDIYIDYGLTKHLTNLVVQKLSYIANGYWIVLKNKRLIEESFEAWNLGPVIPSLYRELKVFGYVHIDYTSPNILEEDITEKIIIERVEDDEVIDFFDFIFDSYKDYTPGELIDLTHRKDGAWHKTINEKGYNAVIEENLIKKEFERILIFNEKY